MDHHLVASAAVFALRVLAATASFVFTMLVTRSIGASGTGIFFTALAVATVISILFRFGADGAVLKYVAREHGLSRYETARSYFLLTLATTVLGGIVGTILLYFSLRTGIRSFGLDAGYSAFLVALCLSVVPLSLMALLSESLKATGRVALSVAVVGLVNFVVGGAVFLPLYARFGDIGVTYAYLAGLVATVLFAAVLLRGYLHTGAVAPVALGDYVRSLCDFWFISILNRAIGPFAPLLLLSVLGTTEQVGLFGTAFRVAMVLSLFIAAADTVLAPRISRLYHRNDLSQLRHLNQRFAFFQNLFVAPLLVAMIVGREALMGLFGPEFVAGADAFVVLAAGQAFNSLTGCVGTILVMTGHERDMLRSSVIGTVIMLMGSILLVPFYGVLGAAIATASGIVATNSAALLFVRWRLGFFVFPWPR